MLKYPNILMCPPTFFEISYQINPWMHINVKASKELAQLQWNKLYETITSLGVDVKLLQPVEDLPDLVFIDAGFLYQDLFIPSNFTHPQRQPERQYFSQWFNAHGYRIVDLPSEFKFEGHGDTLRNGINQVFCGYGFRSQKASFYQIAELIQNNAQVTVQLIDSTHSISGDETNLEMILLELVDPRFYHLDTCFCPLTTELALYFPGAFSTQSCQLLEQKMELIEVTEAEACKFACNALVLDKNIILPSGSPRVVEILRARGFVTFEVEMTEFIKSGGACKCLSMPV